MKPFAPEALETVERRLKELPVGAVPLPLGEVKSRFGRESISAGALYFEVKIEGTPFALTVTALDQQQVDDYGPVRAVSEEVGRLQAAGRFVAYHQVIVAPRGTILLDLVGAERTAKPMPAEASAQSFLEGLLDHDAVRGLLK